MIRVKRNESGVTNGKCIHKMNEGINWSFKANSNY